MKSILSKTLLLISFLVSLHASISAQEIYEIRGKIVKSEKKSESIAKVLLLDSNTMEVIANTYSNSNGEFILENIQRGEYLLMVKKPGFDMIDTRHISITDNVRIMQDPKGPIALKEVNKSATNLN